MLVSIGLLSLDVPVVLANQKYVFIWLGIRWAHTKPALTTQNSSRVLMQPRTTWLSRVDAGKRSSPGRIANIFPASIFGFCLLSCTLHLLAASFAEMQTKSQLQTLNFVASARLECRVSGACEIPRLRFQCQFQFSVPGRPLAACLSFAVACASPWIEWLNQHD